MFKCHLVPKMAQEPTDHFLRKSSVLGNLSYHGDQICGLSCLEFGQQWGDVATIDVVSVVINILKPESVPSHVMPGLREAGC